MSRRSGFWGATAVSLVNAETAGIVAAMTVTPSAARQVVIDNTITSLKNAGAWTVHDLLYFIGARTEQAARVNWKNPAGAQLTGGATYTVDQGWATGILSTGIVFSTLTQLQQNSARAGFYSATTLVGGNHLDATVAGQAFSLGTDATNKSFACNTAGGGAGFTNTALANAGGITGTRMHGISRSASGAHQVWSTDGVTAVSVAASVVSTARSSGTLSLFTVSGKRMFFAGSAMSDAISTAMFTITQTYLNSLAGNP